MGWAGWEEGAVFEPIEEVGTGSIKLNTIFPSVEFIWKMICPEDTTIVYVDIIEMAVIYSPSSLDEQLFEVDLFCPIVKIWFTVSTVYEKM